MQQTNKFPSGKKKRTPPTDDHGQPIRPPLEEGPDGNSEPPEHGIRDFLILLAVICGLFFVLGLFVPDMFTSGGEANSEAITSNIETFLGGIIAMSGTILLAILAIAVIVVIVRNIVIVQQQTACVIERLGKYRTTWNAGLHVKIPFIDRIVNRLSLKEQVLDFEPQSVITKDNVSMKIDAVVYLYITDPRATTYGIQNALVAIENLTATTLRNLIGELTLDETLTSRETVNTQMQSILDEATDPWGIKVTRVELKNILPPKDIQEAMEKQMRAEREKRESILRAEGTKQSRILEAEGVKTATILEAEATKQRMILEAEAEKEAAIQRASGQAEAIRQVKAAEAEGVKAIKAAGADDAVVRLRSLATLEAMAQGKATTIVVPSDLAGLAGTLAGLKPAIAQQPDQGAPLAEEDMDGQIYA